MITFEAKMMMRRIRKLIKRIDRDLASLGKLIDILEAMKRESK
jgi:hypothetical protein